MPSNGNIVGAFILAHFIGRIAGRFCATFVHIEFTSLHSTFYLLHYGAAGLAILVSAFVCTILFLRMMHVRFSWVLCGWIALLDLSAVAALWWWEWLSAPVQQPWAAFWTMVVQLVGGVLLVSRHMRRAEAQR